MTLAEQPEFSRKYAGMMLTEPLASASAEERVAFVEDVGRAMTVDDLSDDSRKVLLAVPQAAAKRASVAEAFFAFLEAWGPQDERLHPRNPLGRWSASLSPDGERIIRRTGPAKGGGGKSADPERARAERMRTMKVADARTVMERMDDKKLRQFALAAHEQGNWRVHKVAKKEQEDRRRAFEVEGQHRVVARRRMVGGHDAHMAVLDDLHSDSPPPARPYLEEFGKLGALRLEAEFDRADLVDLDNLASEHGDRWLGGMLARILDPPSPDTKKALRGAAKDADLDEESESALVQATDTELRGTFSRKKALDLANEMRTGAPKVATRMRRLAEGVNSK